MTDCRIETIAAGPITLRLHFAEDALIKTRIASREAGELPEITSPIGQRFQTALEAYVKGVAVRWPDVPLPMEGLTPFTCAVLTALRGTVPFGATVTYGELAARAGSPKAARAAGSIMAKNPWPLIIPCHRVLGSGNIGGYTPGVELKKTLLGIEGISFDF